MLRNYYHKGRRFRLEGMDSTGWWFTGGTSFMSNGYVIYTNGLDGYPPNPTAVAQGNTYAYRLFDQRSMDKRSSYYQFTASLKAIADRAAANERQFLQMKLQQLRASDINVAWTDKIEQAIHEEDYSSAYTLLLRRDKDLDKFREELNSAHNKSLSKTNEFFNSQFYKFVAERFRSQLESQSGSTRTLTLDTDFEQFVDEYFNDALSLSYDQNQSLGYIRDTFIEGLKGLATNNEIKIEMDLNSIGDGITVGKKRIPKNHILTKKDKFRTPRALADKIAYDLIYGIGMGLSEELHQISGFENIGSKTFSTGSVTRDITDMLGKTYKNESGKNDIMAYDIAGGSINIDDVIKEVYSDGYDESMRAFYTEVEERLKHAAEANPASEFFEIATNVKGYMSQFDLQIEGEGSFANRLNQFKTINLEGNMSDKLIFMLNNTTKGCIMEGREDEIADYLAAVCVAYMWDNVDDIFDLKSEVPSNFRKIYLFSSGGAYLTASQIIYQTLHRLINTQGDSNRFVQVGIKPPSVYGGYTNLMKKYPVEGITSESEWQAQLQHRWDEVRNAALSTGAISIHFNQSELNELLGNLRAIINS